MPKKQTPEEPRHHRDPELDLKILEFIAGSPGCKRSDIVGKFEYSNSSVGQHIRELEADGYIYEGCTLTEKGKKQQTKAYIFIYTESRPISTDRCPGENYQQKLVDEIKTELSSESYRNVLFLDSVDIVMGGDFDVLLSLRSHLLQPIGGFVTGFLRSHPYVFKTQTAMAWPTVSLPQKKD